MTTAQPVRLSQLHEEAVEVSGIPKLCLRVPPASRRLE